MTLGRTEVTTGMIAEYERLAELVRSLSDEEWQTATRCEGWTVADVAAHVSGILDDVVHFRLDDIGSPEAVVRQVHERRGVTPVQLAEELDNNRKLGIDIAHGFTDEAWDGPSPAPGISTLGFGVEGLWYDTYVHGEDIRAAIGRPADRSPESLRASVSHLTQILTDQGYDPAVLAFDGMEEFSVCGGGDEARRITGDPLQFVLVATGRADPATMALDDRINVYRD